MFGPFSLRLLRQSAALPTSASASVDAALRAAQSELDLLSPKKIAEVLDKYIIGQTEAKRAVAVSLRNRWRRRQITDGGLKEDITPKNMLLIGPTGVGKTEIARRMAKLTDAPFVKVEATKYTEVGFKGKDVDSIVEDLYAMAKTKAKSRMEAERDVEALRMAQDILFSSWSSRRVPGGPFADMIIEEFRSKALTDLKDEMVTFEITVPPPAASHHSRRGGMGEGGVDSPGGGSGGLIFIGMAERRSIKKRITKTIQEAMPMVRQEALDKLIDETQVNELARRLAEEDGIVFIDEIDKVVVDPKGEGGEASSTGVQQDLLPLVEGSSITLKDGSTIRTDHVLFICSGAFHVAKPSDMIAELQGRLPVRVELKALKEEDFRRILTQPKYNLLAQQKALMSTENITIEFTDEAIHTLAKVATEVNSNAQNIGARRLHTVIERVMDDYSFNCDLYAGQTIVIDAETVRKATEKLNKNINLAKFLL